MNGAQALVAALEKQGVEVIFGIPGGVVLTIFDALYHSKIKVVLTRHEQGAAHAADGYARATGKVGVCLATSGPGATNLVTGLCNAWMDSVPMVAITGQVNTDMIGRDAFQEADIFGITLPMTKHSYLVKTPDALAGAVAEAFYIASTGRPGPVLIDMPANISATEFKFKEHGPVDLQGYKPVTTGNSRQISSAAKIIAKSQRPVLYVGGGAVIAGADKELKELAERLDIPVTTTLLGKGAFPETHQLSLGMLGMHGTWYANMAVSQCDALIAVGARFDDRVTGKLEEFAKNAEIIHIDIDPAEIGKNIKPLIPIVGDAKSVLGALLEEVKPVKRDAWNMTINAWKAEHPLTYSLEGEGIPPQYVVEKIYEVTKGEAIVCTEVGQNQMWAAQYYKTDRPRHFLTSGGLGTMGYGLPAAIGAQIGMPDALVIDIAGDGSIMMNIQEMATAVSNQLPVKICVLNNGYLGMVRQWQKMFYGGRYSSSIISDNPDLAKIAEAFGAVGISVTEKDDVVPALKKAFKNGKTTIIDFRVRGEENVMPMVPRGSAPHEMIENWNEEG